MNKFNLTFWGEIQAGHDPEKVKARFAKLFDIKDPVRLEHFFSGDTITLRRNLDRKVAGEYYSKLRKLGVESALVKVDPATILAEEQRVARKKTVAKQPDQEHESPKEQWEQARRIAEIEAQQRRQPDSATSTGHNLPAAEEQPRVAEAARAQQKRELAQQEAQRAKAAREEEKRRSEEAARELAAQQEALERKRAEDAAKKKALAEEAAARKKAAKEAEQAKKAAAAAQRKAEREKAKQRAEQEAAKRLAEQDEIRRQQEEAAAIRKAELAARREAEAKEAAQRKAEQEEALKIEAEEAAREKTKIAAATAREKARQEKARQEAAQRKAAEEEKRREEQAQRKEQAAREKASREEAKRLAAAEAEKRKAIEQEKRRKKEARRKESKRLAAEGAAKQKAAEEEKRREEEMRHREKQDAARREKNAKRAEQQAERAKTLAQEKQRQLEERQQVEALEREQAAQREMMEEQAIARAAEKFATQTALKPTKAKVKSNLDLPRRRGSAAQAVAKRQAGAPNFYRLHPFRNSAEIRERASEAAGSTRGGFGIAAFALALLLVLAGRYLSLPTTAPVNGPTAIASAPDNALLMLAGTQLLLHDRSGAGKSSIKASDLGLEKLSPPLLFDQNGEIIIKAQPEGTEPGTEQLVRCDPELKSCKILAGPLSTMTIAALAIHDLTGQLFVADRQAGELLKLSPDTTVLARKPLNMPKQPVIQLDSGLLFMNSAEGPAISVYRYEDKAFGQQLDEVLLLPPPALDREQTRVIDFIRAGDFWWVQLDNPESGSASLYLFDSQWKYLREIPAVTDTRSKLLGWSSKVLLWSTNSGSVQRFADNGTAEAPLESELLLQLIGEQYRAKKLKAAAWFVVFSLLLTVALVGLARGYHQHLRNLVYRTRPTRGAEPLDEHTDSIHWVDPVADRVARVRRVTLSYGVLIIAVIFLCIGLGASVTQLTAALIALVGPLVALTIFGRAEVGHAGTLEDTLVLVDHRDMYHVASGPRIQYRGPFLLIDDVVVFTGTHLLPVLVPEQVRAELNAVAVTGIRVDRKTIAVKLLEAGHPLVKAALAVAAAGLAAGLTLFAAQLL